MSIKKLLLIFPFLLLQTAVAQDLTKDLAAGEKGLETVKLEMGLSDNKVILTLLTKLGNRLVDQLENPLFEYKFYLIDSEEPNAFALPGGKIFVTRGLLALPLTEDELAGVIGHEIIHSNNRHGMKNTSVLGVLVSIPGYIVGGIFGGSIGQVVASPFIAGGQLLQADYSRGFEKEADKDGVILSAKAGYDPLELAVILARLSAEVELMTGEAETRNYFASHPFTPKRVEYIHKKSQDLTASSLEHLSNPEEFLLAFDGLLISANPTYGYISNNIFYQPTQLFSFPISDEWETAITPESFSLGSKEGDAILAFNTAKDSLDYAKFIDSFEEQMRKQNRIEPSDKDDFNWYGRKGKMVEYESLVQNEKVKIRIYAIDYGNGYLMKIAALFKESSAKKVENLLENAKPIKAEDLPPAMVKNIHIVSAHDGETIENLIKRSGAADFKKLILIINGLSEGHVFKGNPKVKIIKLERFNF